MFNSKFGVGVLKHPGYNDIGSIISAGASIVGGLMGSDASQSAADTQAAAANQATAEQQRQFDINQANQAPWLAAGKNALAQLNGGNFDVTQTPGYQFRLDEGLKALDRSAAARGGLLSGAALRGATRYGQDYASNEYTNAYNRIASQAGLGQTAANNLGAYGQQYATNIGNNLMNAGNAAASGYVGSANAWSNALGGAANAYNKYAAGQQAGNQGFGFGNVATPNFNNSLNYDWQGNYTGPDTTIGTQAY